jgi:hypothetical protein
VNCGTVEGHSLSLTRIPLVHCVDGIDAIALLAGKVGRSQRRAVESGSAEGPGVVHDHVRGSTGGERRNGNDFGEHVEV